MTLPPDDPDERALAAFHAVLDARLAGAREMWIPALLGDAFAAGFRVLLKGRDEEDLGGLHLPGCPDWMSHLDAPELVDPVFLREALWIEPDELLEVVADIADEIEVLALTNDGGWWDDVCAVRLRGWVGWFHTGVDQERWTLHRSHEESEPGGRRRLLLDLAEIHLPVGQVEVELGDAFDDELRRALRRAAEARGTAPWDTGDLRGALVDLSDPSLGDLVAELALALTTDRAEVLAALRRLRGVPDLWPPNELDRTVAWNVCWPALRLGS